MNELCTLHDYYSTTIFSNHCLAKVALNNSISFLKTRGELLESDDPNPEGC